MLAGSHRNAWPDETGTGGRTNRNTQLSLAVPEEIFVHIFLPLRIEYPKNPPEEPNF